VSTPGHGVEFFVHAAIARHTHHLHFEPKAGSTFDYRPEPDWLEPVDTAGALTDAHATNPTP